MGEASDAAMYQCQVGVHSDPIVLKTSGHPLYIAHVVVPLGNHLGPSLKMLV